MYYRKYFSGSVDATTTTNQYYMGLDKVATGTSRASGHIKNRSDVIGNALVSTFKDIGYPNAYWDSTSGYFFFDKSNALSGIYISVQSSYMYFNIGYRGTNYVTATSTGTSRNNYGGGVNVSNSASPFNSSGTGATNYAFYVTVKGEPKGMMKVFIGTYSDHSSETAMSFDMCLGKDKRNDNAVIAVTFVSGDSNYQFVVNDYTSADNYESLSFATQTNRLTMRNEVVVLIPLFFQVGYFVMDNTYINCGINSGFYEIDGDIYFAGSYFVTKCITEI